MLLSVFLRYHIYSWFGWVLMALVHILTAIQGKIEMLKLHYAKCIYFLGAYENPDHSVLLLFLSHTSGRVGCNVCFGGIIQRLRVLQTESVLQFCCLRVTANPVSSDFKLMRTNVLLNHVPAHDCPIFVAIHRTKCKPMHLNFRLQKCVCGGGGLRSAPSSYGFVKTTI